EASGRETAAPEMPPPEEVPLATVPGARQDVEAVVAEPPMVRESRKRGPEGVDANAPPNDPDPLAFAGAPSHPPVDVAQSSQGVAVAEDPGLTSLEIKGSLDADKDIGVDEVSSAINGVFDIGESNMEIMEVRSKLGEFSKNKEVVVGGGEARGVDKDESNRVISVLKDDSLDEINMGLSEEFVIRVLGRDVSGESLVVSLKLVCHEKSHEVLSVTSWSAKGRQRVLCYVQDNRMRRKKSVGVTKSSFANKDVAMGKEAKI
nr:hypothetical protein [Tanacetum cinerariifolium]